MVWLVLVFVCYVLSCSTIPVTGQCTVSSCAVSASVSEERLQLNLEEHDHRLETMNQSMLSELGKLETTVNRTKAVEQEDLCKDLKILYYNMSVNLEKVTEQIPVRIECHATQEQEEYLNSMKLNLTLMIVRTDERIQAVNESLSSTLQTVSRSLDDKFQMLNETFSSAIDKISERLNALLDHVKNSNQAVKSEDPCRNTSDVYDCSDIKANGYTASGVYRIYVVDQGQRYYANAFCDMTTTNDAWTVFQRRKDGSVDFYREWNEYANGFGNPSGEFWLGNNFLHLLTSKRRYRLRIDLEDFEGGKRYAEYSTFNISSSADKYRLRIGTYSGIAGDSLNYHNGQRFSTKDSDNDAYTLANLAVVYHAAWWYPNGHSSNLNGLYLRGPYNLTSCSPTCYEGIEWHGWRGHAYSLKTTEMKLSPR